MWSKLLSRTKYKMEKRNKRKSNENARNKQGMMLVGLKS